jgi:hypothetical protein
MIHYFTDGSGEYGTYQKQNRGAFFYESFYKGYRSYNRKDEASFDIKREFLTDDEHRELFGWLDDYMLQFKPDKYIEFAVLMLTDPFMETLFPKEELRRIYDMIRNMDIDAVKQNTNELKRKFLSEAELQAEKDAEEIREQEQKKKYREQQIQSLKNELNDTYNGTFESILKYLDAHKHSWKNEDDAMTIAAQYLDTVFEEKDYILNKEEISQFLIISGKLMKKGYLDFDTFENHILAIREDKEYVKNNRTPESDSDPE